MGKVIVGRSGTDYESGGISGMLELPWLTYCSALVCFTERKVNPQFMEPYPTCQVSPQEIDDWLSMQDGWEVTTFKLA